MNHLGWLALLLLCTNPATAQDEPSIASEGKEAAAILELGGSGEWPLNGGTSSYGPNIAVEVTPIENWLEIEAGTSPLFGGGRVEWDTDLLFKKPFALSDTVEFMPGVGPAWVHSGGHNSIASEAALDFMIWPLPDRKFGWYVEPTYSYEFARGHQQSLSISAGLLISLP